LVAGVRGQVVSAPVGWAASSPAAVIGSGGPEERSQVGMLRASQGCRPHRPGHHRVRHYCSDELQHSNSLSGLNGLVGNGDSVSIANTTVTATWSQSSAGTPGFPSICAAVKIVNHNSSTIRYNERYWSLQSPNGTAVHSNVGAGGLGWGNLVAGEKVAGTVCFDDPGRTGPTWEFTSRLH
jgi:hypothetical protein